MLLERVVSRRCTLRLLERVVVRRCIARLIRAYQPIDSNQTGESSRISTICPRTFCRRTRRHALCNRTCYPIYNRCHLHILFSNSRGLPHTHRNSSRTGTSNRSVLDAAPPWGGAFAMRGDGAGSFRKILSDNRNSSSSSDKSPATETYATYLGPLEHPCSLSRPMV